MSQGNQEVNTVRFTNILIFVGTIAFYSVVYFITLPIKEKACWSIAMLLLLVGYLFIKYRLALYERKYKIPVRYSAIRSLALLNEEGNILREWDIFGQTGLLIGKNSGNHHVDIDLSLTADAPFISRQHAVLNYYNQNWYIEDAGSKNGIEIKKADQERVLMVTETKPIKLDRGDVIKINETALMLR